MKVSTTNPSKHLNVISQRSALPGYHRPSRDPPDIHRAQGFATIQWPSRSSCIKKRSCEGSSSSYATRALRRRDNPCPSGCGHPSTSTKNGLPSGKCDQLAEDTICQPIDPRNSAGNQPAPVERKIDQRSVNVFTEAA